MTESAHLDKEPGVTHSDAIDLTLAGGNWVGEVFGLFRLGAEGWSDARGGGWKWDINVENSFEVGSQDPSHSPPDTTARKELFEAV